MIFHLTGTLSSLSKERHIRDTWNGTVDLEREANGWLRSASLTGVFVSASRTPDLAFVDTINSEPLKSMPPSMGLGMKCAFLALYLLASTNDFLRRDSRRTTPIGKILVPWSLQEVDATVRQVHVDDGCILDCKWPIPYRPGLVLSFQVLRICSWRHFQANWHLQQDSIDPRYWRVIVSLQGTLTWSVENISRSHFQ